MNKKTQENSSHKHKQPFYTSVFPILDFFVSLIEFKNRIYNLNQV